MVQHYTGLPVDSAQIKDLDKLGLNVDAKYEGENVTVRLPFTRCVWRIARCWQGCLWPCLRCLCFVELCYIA